ncbi:hypothetical protein ACFVZH_38600 [Streptomyces sp. NPDC059534]|uniref:hypothetical protein n=1 Tax=Streptomyces sp. NPDC059534 TaxID=3346859 RepID=UPI0036B413BD
MTTSIRLPRMAAPTVFVSGRDGLAVIDTIAVERAVTGNRNDATLTTDEAQYAASLLLEAGIEYTLVAVQVGVDRRTLRGWFPEQTRTVRSTPPVCGTPRGYKAHLRRGEIACTGCKAAAATARRRPWELEDAA